MDCLIGVDIGTSSSKAAAFSPGGRVLASAESGYPTYRERPGWAEQSADDWYAAAVSCLRDIASSVSPQSVAAIAVAGQSWACVPVDSCQNALSPTPIWMDTRADKICRDIRRSIGDETIIAVNGNSFLPGYTTPKMLWFKEHCPDVYNKTRFFMQSNSFIAMRLCGVATMDLSQIYGIHCINMQTASADASLCADMGLDPGKIPPIVDCHQIIGRVTREAARLTGLVEGTPVVAGGLDAACATLGAGCAEPGMTQEMCGTSGGVMNCHETFSPDKRLIFGRHAVPGLYLLQGGTVGGGGALKWLKAAFENDESFDAFLAGCESLPPGSRGTVFLPYLAGERTPIWDKDAQGVFFGLNYETTRAHMVRAVLEGCAFSVRHNIETVSDAGGSVSALHSTGGGAKSRIWAQIKADVTGVPVREPESPHSTALGAAMLAGIGAGVYNGFDDAVRQAYKCCAVYEPDMRKHEVYSDYYQIYLSVYKNLKEDMRGLSRLREKKEL